MRTFLVINNSLLHIGNKPRYPRGIFSIDDNNENNSSILDKCNNLIIEGKLKEIETPEAIKPKRRRGRRKKNN